MFAYVGIIQTLKDLKALKGPRRFRPTDTDTFAAAVLGSMTLWEVEIESIRKMLASAVDTGHSN